MIFFVYLFVNHKTFHLATKWNGTNGQPKIEWISTTFGEAHKDDDERWESGEGKKKLLLWWCDCI